MCPNWCAGYVEVKGKPKDIENFCKLFIFEEEDGKKNQIQKHYFARSFVYSTWKDFKEEIKEELKQKCVGFAVDFAWAGSSCLIEGYPTDNKKDNPCVTLEWACKKYNVEVDIQTEERGECFEEHITYTKQNGFVTEDSWAMPTKTCQVCGNEQQFPTQMIDSLNDEECYECETIGKWGDKDELTEIMEQKIKQIKETKEKQNG